MCNHASCIPNACVSLVSKNASMVLPRALCGHKHQHKNMDNQVAGLTGRCTGEDTMYVAIRRVCARRSVILDTLSTYQRTLARARIHTHCTRTSCTYAHIYMLSERHVCYLIRRRVRHRIPPKPPGR